MLLVWVSAMVIASFIICGLSCMHESLATQQNLNQKKYRIFLNIWAIITVLAIIHLLLVALTA